MCPHSLEHSLWAALREGSRREEVKADFTRLLREGIAAAPERAAREWHVILLYISREDN